MIEFIDLETIKAVILLLLASLLLVSSLKHNSQKKEKRWQTNKKSNSNYYWLTYIVLLTLIPLIEANSAKERAELNIKNFRGVKVLRCTTKEYQYRVSKKDGWQEDGYFFIKDSLLVRADRCNSSYRDGNII